jgi:hypothetical protein
LAEPVGQLDEFASQNRRVLRRAFASAVEHAGDLRHALLRTGQRGEQRSDAALRQRRRFRQAAGVFLDPPDLRADVLADAAQARGGGVAHRQQRLDLLRQLRTVHVDRARKRRHAPLQLGRFDSHGPGDVVEAACLRMAAPLRDQPDRGH